MFYIKEHLTCRLSANNVYKIAVNTGDKDNLTLKLINEQHVFFLYIGTLWACYLLDFMSDKLRYTSLCELVFPTTSYNQRKQENIRPKRPTYVSHVITKRDTSA